MWLGHILLLGLFSLPLARAAQAASLAEEIDEIRQVDRELAALGGAAHAPQLAGRSERVPLANRAPYRTASARSLPSQKGRGIDRLGAVRCGCLRAPLRIEVPMRKPPRTRTRIEPRTVNFTQGAN